MICVKHTRKIKEQTKYRLTKKKNNVQYLIELQMSLLFKKIIVNVIKEQDSLFFFYTEWLKQ